MRLTANQWDAIRDEWEYSPDQLSYVEAGNRAATKHEFKRPSKQTIHSRAKHEGWQRKGASLASVNLSAHILADRLVKAGVGAAPLHTTDAKTDDENLKKVSRYRQESESVRAEIRARHRQEWEQIASLKQQALAKRNDDPNAAFQALKNVKITAEITALQQAGECRAWKLDEWVDREKIRSMSNEELEEIVSGKSRLSN